jgi:hypothetical protein
VLGQTIGEAIGKAAGSAARPKRPGISVKLSAVPSNVGYWGQSGKHRRYMSNSPYDPHRARVLHMSAP